MDNPHAHLDHGWPRVAAILTPLIGGMVYCVQPGFVQGLTEYAGFSDRDAGYLAAAEMVGIALTSVVLTFIAHRIHWRRAVTAFFALELLGNVASIGVHDFVWLGVVRFLVGIGSGGAISLGFALIGMTSAPERNFGWNIGLAGLYAAVVMFALPAIFHAVGLTGLLLFFASFAAFGLWLVRYLPDRGAHGEPGAGGVELSWLLKAPALGAILLYFSAQGAVWAYLFLIGTAGTLSEAQVASALTLSGIAGILGGFTPTVLGDRAGRAGPLTIGVTIGLVAVWYLVGSFSAASYALAVSVYVFAWNMTHPFLLATYASFDRSGRVVVYAAALQTIGMAVGPAIGASLITEGHYAPVNYLAVVLFVACLLLILPATLMQARTARAAAAAAASAGS